MNLDPRTLLFALILTNAMMVLGLFVASASKRESKREGMGKWALAVLLETLTWMLIAARGTIPDIYSVVVANALKAGAHALVLAAIYEFQQRPLPRWQYVLPVILTVLMAALLLDDMRGRFVWGSLIFGFQMALVIRALLSDPETRTGQAWRLLLGGVLAIMAVLCLRAFVALNGSGDLSQPQTVGTIHWVQFVSFVAIMATTLLGSLGFVFMVKERADREIRHLAMTDSLTGVPNRRALLDYAGRMLAQRGERSMALLMIDVDHFKRINDTHGHPAGDDVLRETTRLLAGRLRGGDLLGRYGGEEFCVVVPDAGMEGAMAMAESLRATVAASVIATEYGALSVTVSIGVAHCPAGRTCELKDLLAEADAALYTAKRDGRNRVAVFQEVQQPEVRAQNCLTRQNVA
ncbi:MAG TPA: GGDEF domain-containing protein [Sideroxyarcus sp.]|nr:GGDEF domain-containing protein [Sideroxyarcus sp.]